MFGHQEASVVALLLHESDSAPQPVELSVLLPAYNEAESIQSTIQNLCSYMEKSGKPFEIVVAEDGSVDGTKEVLSDMVRECPLRVASAKQRQGYAKAVLRGVDLCGSETVFFSDSDGQYRFADFDKLNLGFERQDMTIGRKVLRQDPFHRRFVSTGFHLLTRILFGVQLHDIDCGFRVFRKDLTRIVSKRERYLKHSFWAEFTILAWKGGFKINEVPVSHYPRARGATSIYQSRKLPRIIVSQIIGLIRLRAHLNQELVRAYD